MKRLLLIALALAAFQPTVSAQFIDRIVRPCPAAQPRASVIVNPSGSGNVDVTTCTGGVLNVNGVPATATPGGSNTQFQYNDAGTFAGAPAFTYTKAATSQLVAVVPTWNSAGTTFTAFKINATDTASAVGSALLDLQVGGTTLFKVDKFGNVTDGGGWSWARPNGRLSITTSTNGTPLSLAGYSLTAADASPGFSLTGIWNTSGAPAAIFANITNTASGAAAKLLDLQIGSASQFSVSKAGVADLATGYRVGGAASLGNYLRGDATNFVSSAIQVADVPTLNQNTSGTAANLSGTPALPNGTTATTQSQADASTKLATTAYVDTGLGAKAPTADPVFTSSLQLPNGAAPVTNLFGEIAGDNNAWGAGRGAVQWSDGTADTWLVGILSSDTCINGQVPTWNTGGTWTCETPAATPPGGSSGDLQTNNGAGGFGAITPGAGVSTFLATPSSANLASAVTGDTGSGALVFGTGPTISSPIITNIAPGANFTLTQNSVAPFTSVNSGAIVNTLYLTAGNVGIGTTTPDLAATGAKTLTIQGSAVRSYLELSNSTTGTSGIAGSIHGTNGSTILTYINSIADGATNSGKLVFGTFSAGSAADKLTIDKAGAITLSSGITDATGTPGSLCYNTSTFVMLKNNALTCTVSAREYKTEIKLMTKGLEYLLKMEPRQFFYKDHPKRSRWGFMSDELQAVDSRLGDGYDAKGEAKSIDIPAILAVNTRSIQQLHAIVIAQGEEIKKLNKLLRKRQIK